MTTRIKLSRARGWRKPEGTIVVARPGPWGNPFVVGKYGTAAECVAQFTLLAHGYLDLGTGTGPCDEQIRLARRIRDQIHELAGHDLACWCQIGKPCHADVLLDLAAGRDPRRDWMLEALTKPRIMIRLEDWEKMAKDNAA